MSNIEDIQSPCVGVCTLSDTTGFCQGCDRTIEEIREWWNMTDEARAKTMSELDERMANSTSFD